MAPSGFLAFLETMKPSIGASTASVPYCGSIAGNAKKSRSFSESPSNCWGTKLPSRYMPDFFLTRSCAASCQVRPSEPGWWYGSRPAQVSKTA